MFPCPFSLAWAFISCVHDRLSLKQYQRTPAFHNIIPYKICQSPSVKHSCIPLIEFIGQVAVVGPTACKAILDAGFLHVLLCIYTHDFFDPFLAAENAKGRDHIDQLRHICDGVLNELCRHQECSDIIFNHPISVLWPRDSRSSLIWTGMAKQRPQYTRFHERKRTWESLNPQFVDRRLRSILNCPSIWSERSSRTTERLDVCIDVSAFLM
jgi:hypothetical protein